ncbi:nitrate/TMAO reductase, membrane-bound tetraheme cytochrome c subunit [Desulfosporosinus acidiphilus SJ4]|uniref:Nitrate/TMAO reductase, membrane-bound tetraheme cytochrome c subunit n=1 Tax=Desulfosporosinus acidiphilus (strain DSM 22704 / JCM 16185 / SJ4) TaxID=646529 RepID=I4D5R4_DESAJ|nr:NapC/NirT family cytochrome c [Desulfosporosinus acidiphilus]AFM41138.1 nitrate/TMAO reductase, membrane-bound tetraheme cytochrome c subunit [Desulfosporosinus acidiphilus SJ4]
MWKKILLGSGITVVGLYVLFQVGYYATSGPNFCGSCHEVNKYVTSWQTAAHKNVNCLDCHRDTGHAVDIYLRPDLKGYKQL